MIVISGAARGIGKFVLQHFVEKGFDVIGIYNKTKPTEYENHYFQLDVTSELDVVNFVASFPFKDIVLLNFAGETNASMAHKQSIDSFRNTLEINTIAVFSLIKNLLPLMREQGYGRIINISSVVPQIGTPGNVAYATSKSALWGMSKVLAKENATKGITSNCLNLGYCEVGMIDTIPTDILKEIIDTIPQKKLCKMHNIINAIEFLISSDYVTGIEIDINGGLY